MFKNIFEVFVIRLIQSLDLNFNDFDDVIDFFQKLLFTDFDLFVDLTILDELL